MPKNKRTEQTKRAREAKAASQNTTASNQLSNASNPAPNVQPVVLNQNLPISAAPAVALLQSQEIQSPDTHDDMDASQNDPNDANTINNNLSNQQPNLLAPPILTNQNLPISAAPAAADLLQSQETQFPITHNAMDTSKSEAIKAYLAC